MPNCKIFYKIISDGEETVFETMGDFLRRNDAYNVVFYTTEEGQRTKNSYTVFKDRVFFSRSGDTSYSITLKKGVVSDCVMKLKAASLPFFATLDSFSYELSGGRFCFDLSYDLKISSLTLKNKVSVKVVLL